MFFLRFGKRLVLVSSNHATGCQEADIHAGVSNSRATPHSDPRPDGLYGVSKLFAEGIVRAVAESFGLPVSVLRLGAMRWIDDPEQCQNGPRFPKMSEAEYRARMRAAWMSHEGWGEAVIEELSARDRFRLRYASDGGESAPWVTDEVARW